MIPSPASIIEQTCLYFKVEVEAIMSRSHFQRISDIRNVAMYLLRFDAKMSHREIGILFYNRHHTTVMHNIGVAAERMRIDPERVQQLAELRKAIAAAGIKMKKDRPALRYHGDKRKLAQGVRIVSDKIETPEELAARLLMAEDLDRSTFVVTWVDMGFRETWWSKEMRDRELLDLREEFAKFIAEQRRIGAEGAKKP